MSFMDCLHTKLLKNKQMLTTAMALMITVFTVSEVWGTDYVYNGSWSPSTPAMASLNSGDTVDIQSDLSYSNGLTIPEGVTVTVESGYGLYVNNDTFTVNGNLINYGTTSGSKALNIGTNGSITNNGTLLSGNASTNKGTFINNGTYTASGGTYTNKGNVTNNYGATITAGNGLKNEGYITNKGTIEANSITNSIDGTIANSSSGTITATSGTITNSGTINSSGEISASTSISNTGTFTNAGTVKSASGVTTSGSGTFDTSNGVVSGGASGSGTTGYSTNNYIFTGSTNSAWSEASNWYGGSVPIIDGSASATILLKADAVADGLTFFSSSTKNITILLNEHTLTCNGSFNLDGSNNTLTIKGPGTVIAKGLDSKNSGKNYLSLDTNVDFYVTTSLYGDLDTNAEFKISGDSNNTCTIYIPASGANVNWGTNQIEYENITRKPNGTPSVYTITSDNANPYSGNSNNGNLITITNTGDGYPDQILNYYYKVTTYGDSNITWTLAETTISNGSTGIIRLKGKGTNGGCGTYYLKANKTLSSGDGIVITFYTPDSCANGGTVSTLGDSPMELAEIRYIQDEIKWTGSTSVDWGNSSNWNGVSSTTRADLLNELASASVVIPSGCTNYPSISSAASIGTLTIKNNAHVTVSSTLTVQNGISCTGTGYINASSGTVIFSDTTDTSSAITWTAEYPEYSSFGTLTIGASNTFTPSSDVYITGTLTNNAGGTYNGSSVTTVFSGTTTITGNSSDYDKTVFGTLSCTKQGGKTISIVNKISVTTLNLSGISEASLLTVNGNGDIKLASSQTSGQYLNLSADSVVPTFRNANTNTYTVFNSTVPPSMTTLNGRGWILGDPSTYIWQGRSTDWTAIINWSSGIVPSTGSEVVIPAGCSYYPTLTKAIDLSSSGTLTIEENASLNLSGYALTAKDFTLNGTLALKGTETFTISGTTSISSTTAILTYSENSTGSINTTVFGTSITNIEIETGANITADESLSITNLSGSGTLICNGDLSLTNATTDASGITYKFSGSNDQTFTNANTSSSYKVSLAKTGGTLTFANTIIFSSFIDYKEESGSKVSDSSANLTFAGDVTFPTDTQIYSSGLITMNGSQFNTASSFRINTSFTNAGTTTYSNDLIISGNFKDTGTFSGGKTITLNGTAAQSFTASSSSTYAKIDINRTASTDVTFTNALKSTLIYLEKNHADSTYGNTIFSGAVTTAALQVKYEYKNLKFNAGLTATTSTLEANTDISGTNVNFGVLSVTSGKATLKSDCSATSVTISSGAVLNGTEDKSITVKGSWTNSGTFTANSGTVIFDDSSSHTVSGTSTFNKVTLNSSATFNGENTFTALTASGLGGKTLTLNADQTVTGTLTLSGTSADSRLSVADDGNGKGFILSETESGGSFLSISPTVLIKNSGGTCDGVNGIYYTAGSSVPSAGTANTDYAAVIRNGWRIKALGDLSYRWTGGTADHETEWSAAANWDIGIVPGAASVTDGATVTIPAGCTNYPVLSAAASLSKITIESGACLSLNGKTLSVTNTASGEGWNNAGTVYSAGSETVTLGTAAESGTWIFSAGTIPVISNLTYNNIEINGGVSASSAFAGTNITGTLTVDTGKTLSTGGDISFTTPIVNNGTIDAGSFALTFASYSGTSDTISVNGGSVTNSGAGAITIGTLSLNGTGKSTLTGGTGGISVSNDISGGKLKTSGTVSLKGSLNTLNVDSGTAAAAGDITVSGTGASLTVNSGAVLAAGTNQLILTGSGSDDKLSVTGTGSITVSASQKNGSYISIDTNSCPAVTGGIYTAANSTTATTTPANGWNILSGALIYVWNGSSSDALDTAANWNTGIRPDSAGDIEIAVVASGSKYPVLTADAEYNSILIDEGASFDFSGYSAKTTASFTNNGTIRLKGGNTIETAASGISFDSSSTIEYYGGSTAAALTIKENNASVDTASFYRNLTVTGSGTTLQLGAQNITVAGVLSSEGTVEVNGTGDFIITGTPDTDSGLIKYSTGKTGLGTSVFYNLEIAGGESIINTGTTVYGSLTVSGGTLNAGAALTVTGSTTNNGTIICSASELTFSGNYTTDSGNTAVLTASGGITYFSSDADLSLTAFDSNSGTVIFNGNSAQELTAAASTVFSNIEIADNSSVTTSSSFKVAADWTDSNTSGGFTASGGTITFSGNDVTVSGKNTFHNAVFTGTDTVTLTGNNTFSGADFTGTAATIMLNDDNTFGTLSFTGAGSTVKSGAGKTQTVSSLKSKGADGNRITLTSDAASPSAADQATWWILDLPSEPSADDFYYTDIEFCTSVNELCHDWGTTVAEKTTGSTSNLFYQNFYWYGTKDTKWTTRGNWKTGKDADHLRATDTYPVFDRGINNIIIADSANILTLENDVSVISITVNRNQTFDAADKSMTAVSVTNNGTIRLKGASSQTISAAMVNGTDSTVEYYGGTASSPASNLCWDGDSSTAGKQYENLILTDVTSSEDTALLSITKSLQINGNTTLAAPVSVAQTAEITAAAALSGTFSVTGTTTVSTTGDVTLNNAGNIFAGGVTLTDGGAVTLNAATQFTLADGASASGLTVSSPVNLAGTVTTTGNQNYNSPVTTNGNLTASGTDAAVTFGNSAPVTLNGDTTVSASAITFGADVTGAAYSLTLNGNSTVSAQVSVTAAEVINCASGTITIPESKALTINGKLSSSGNISASAELIINGAMDNNPGAYVSGSTVSISGDLKDEGNLSSAICFYGTAAQTFTANPSSVYTAITNSCSDSAAGLSTVNALKTESLINNAKLTLGSALDVTASLENSGTLVLGGKLTSQAVTNKGTITVGPYELETKGFSTDGTNVITVEGGTLTASNSAESMTIPNVSVTAGAAFSGGTGGLKLADALFNASDITTTGIVELCAGTIGNLDVTSGSLTLSDDTIVTDLTISSGAVLNGTEDKSITVKGDWTNSGTFTANSGTVIFDDSSSHTVSGTSTFNKVTLNSSATFNGENTFTALTASGLGGKTLTLNADQTVTGTLTLSGTSADSRLSVADDGNGKGFILSETESGGSFLSISPTVLIKNSGGTCDGVNGIYYTAGSSVPSAGTANTDYAAVIRNGWRIKALGDLSYRWTGGTADHETEWSAAANWDIGIVPGTASVTDGATVTIPEECIFYPEINTESYSVKSLSIGTDSASDYNAKICLTGSGNLKIADGTDDGILSNYGKIIYKSSGRIINSAGNAINDSDSGTVEYTGDEADGSITDIDYYDLLISGGTWSSSTTIKINNKLLITGGTTIFDSGVVNVNGTFEIQNAPSVQINAGLICNDAFSVPSTANLVLGGTINSGNNNQTYNCAVALSDNVILAAGTGTIEFYGNLTGSDKELTLNSQTALSEDITFDISKVIFNEDVQSADGKVIICKGKTEIADGKTITSSKITFGDDVSGSAEDAAFTLSAPVEITDDISLTTGTVIFKNEIIGSGLTLSLSADVYFSEAAEITADIINHGTINVPSVTGTEENPGIAISFKGNYSADDTSDNSSAGTLAGAYTSEDDLSPDPFIDFYKNVAFGTLIINRDTIRLAGNENQSLKANGQTLADLIFSGAETVTVTDNFMADNLLIENGSSLALAASNQITIKENWTNNNTTGGFTPAKGNVIFDSGKEHIISGSQTFYKLELKDSADITGSNTYTDFTAGTSAAGLGGKEITFTAGQTQTISGTFTAYGTDIDNLLKLRSSTEKTQWNINAADYDIQYVDVQDSCNMASAYLYAFNSKDIGNNTKWNFIGQKYIWTGSTSSDWFNQNNWSPESVPGTGAVVLIPAVDSNIYPKLEKDLLLTQDDSTFTDENGSITLSDSASQLDIAEYSLTASSITNNGTIRLKGTSAQTISAAMVNGTDSTVEYYGGTASSPASNLCWDGDSSTDGKQYENLILTDVTSSEDTALLSVAKSLQINGNTTLAAPVSVAQTAEITAAAALSGTFSVIGATTVNTTGDVTLNNDGNIFAGGVTLTDGGAVIINSADDLVIKADANSSSLLIYAPENTVTFNGDVTTSSGALTINTSETGKIDTKGSLTSAAEVSITGNLTTSGGTTDSESSISASASGFTVNGSWTNTGFTSASAKIIIKGNLINSKSLSIAQSISVNGNLTNSNTGTLNIDDSATINGNLENSGSAEIKNGAFVTGNFTDTGIWTSSDTSGVITLNGKADQEAVLYSDTTYNSITINKTSGNTDFTNDSIITNLTVTNADDVTFDGTTDISNLKITKADSTTFIDQSTIGTFDITNATSTTFSSLAVISSLTDAPSAGSFNFTSGGSIANDTEFTTTGTVTLGSASDHIFTFGTSDITERCDFTHTSGTSELYGTLNAKNITLGNSTELYGNINASGDIILAATNCHANNIINCENLNLNKDISADDSVSYLKLIGDLNTKGDLAILTNLMLDGSFTSDGTTTIGTSEKSSDFYLFASADTPSDISVNSITVTGNFIISADRTISTSGTISAANIVLYNGDIIASDNSELSAKNDIVLLGNEYNIANSETGNTTEYIYQNSKRLSSYNYERSDFAKASSTESTDCFPDGTLLPTGGNDTSTFNGTYTGGAVSILRAGKNFYANGLQLSGNSNHDVWFVEVVDLTDANNGFAEAYNCKISDSTVRCYSDNSTDGSLSRIPSYNCEDEDNNINWIFDDFDFVKISTVRDNCIKLQFNRPIRNTNGELTASLSRFTNSDSTYIGFYTDPDCSSSLTNKNIDQADADGYYTVYLQAENSWNTDATGESAGSESATDRSGNHKSVIPYVEVANIKYGELDTITDIWGKKLKNYNGDKRYTSTIDATGPVLYQVRTGQELHDIPDGTAESQHSYDAHNFIEFRYSEPVNFGSESDSSSGVWIPAFTDEENTTVNVVENIPVTDEFGALTNSDISKSGSLDFAGIGTINCKENFLYTGSNGKANKYVNALYRKDAYSICISIAGYTEGEVTNPDNYTFKKWTGYIEKATLPSGSVEMNFATDSSTLNPYITDLNGNCQEQYPVSTQNTIPVVDNSENGLYGAWDISKPVFAPWRISKEWSSALINDETGYFEAEAIGNTIGEGSTLNCIEFHLFDNTPSFSKGEPEWVSQIGWIKSGAEGSKSNLYKDYSYGADIFGGSREFADDESSRTSGGIRYSTICNQSKAFKYHKKSGKDDSSAPDTSFAVSNAYGGASGFIFTGSSSPRRSASDLDGLYFGMPLGVTNYESTSSFSLSYDSSDSYITDLAGNRLGSARFETLDRTPPAFNITLSPVNKDELYITFVKNLVTDSKDLSYIDNETDTPSVVSNSGTFEQIIPYCFELISIDENGIPSKSSDLMIDTSRKAQITKYNGFTGIKLYLNHNVTLNDVENLYVSVVNHPDFKAESKDPFTSHKDSHVTFIQDENKNYLEMYSAHALSDFAINTVKPIYAYDESMTISSSEASTADTSTDALFNGLYQEGTQGVHDWSQNQQNYGTLPASTEEDPHPVAIVAETIDGTTQNENPALNAIMYLSNKPDAASVSTQYNSDFAQNLRIWLPSQTDKVFAAFAKANNTNYKTVNSQVLDDESEDKQLIFHLPSELTNTWSSGDQISFLFAITDDLYNPVQIVHSPELDLNSSTQKYLTNFTKMPLFALRLSDINDITSIDLWSFRLKTKSTQRGGVSILNNVINPVNGEKTVIQIDNPSDGKVNIILMTLDGNVVTYLNRGELSKGEHYFTWDGKTNKGINVARGIYFVRVTGNGFDETRKILIVK